MISGQKILKAQATSLLEGRKHTLEQQRQLIIKELQEQESSSGSGESRESEEYLEGFDQEHW